MKNNEPVLGTGKTVVLGLQHTFTMFGATILVPILTGLNISVALFMAGAGTLLFHLLTKGGIPVFLGSSFAFIIPVGAASTLYGAEYALGGIVAAGAMYLVFAVLVYFLGADRIISFFPPVVTGPVIVIIGLNLAPVAIGSASGNWLLALLSFAVVVCVSVFCKGFLKMLPVLIGLTVSYGIAALITAAGLAPLVDFAPVSEAAWFGLPEFTVAKFNLGAVMLIIPVTICTIVEHIGDVAAVGAITGQDYIKKPGLHRTLLGDGLATSFSALFGGPANTTYSENTGVLALTGVFNPVIMRIAAGFAICLSVIPKIGAVIQTIPDAVIGGISIVLFGMIASVGVRTLTENQVDFKSMRNMIISAVILVLGLGGASVQFAVGSVDFNIQGMALSAIAGIILNKVLPDKDKEDLR